MKSKNKKSSLNSKVGKSWSLNSESEEENALPDNFIMGMTNQSTGYNSN